jgi:predicted transcriptional regulator
MEKTAKILGISQWELSQYIGATNQGVADMNLTYTKDIKQRLKDAEEIFK